ncbi:MAG: flagellar hook-associated protein FlgK [Lachnospiraceae bacterium]|nr:flagellar hook-associated protein FlgK [Lachnospiraceae bacterium]
MGSIFGTLYVGTSGLKTSQNALNTTAHNMTNLDTEGYTRQQVMLGTTEYETLAITPDAVANKQIGSGVYYSRVKQIRDVFLDQTYRREAGRSAFYQVSYEVLEEAESLLGEFEGVSFQTAYADLWESVQELAKDPGNAVTQGMLVQYSAVFLERATSVYEGFEKYQDNLNIQIQQTVDKINSFGEQLLSLNEEIRKIECGGTERANDLRDVRNSLLDELATYANITYKENADTTVSVRIEGNDFVKGDVWYQIGLQTDEATGFHTPFWIINAKASYDADGNKIYDIEGAEVFDLSRTISTGNNTDVGKLKSMLLARGDHRATYKDLEDADYYNETVAPSILMNLQAEFDRLIHHVTTEMNKVLESGENPWSLFVEIADVGGEFSTGNIQVNPELMKEPSLLSFRKVDGEIDHQKADALKDLFTVEEYTLNPNVKKKTTLEEFYEDFVSQVANSAYVFHGIQENQEVAVSEAESAREQIVGVSTDEELTNMIMYQNAYNAASRYINVVNEMIEHIIRTLAM